MTDGDPTRKGEGDAFAEAFDGPQAATPDGFVEEVPPADAETTDVDPFAAAFNGPTDTPADSYIQELPPELPHGGAQVASDDADGDRPGPARGG